MTTLPCLPSITAIAVSTSVVVPEADYYLAGTNPSEIGITYNDDGTINMYIPTQFEADMDELYYQITIGDIRYTSRDKIARIEGIPNIPYAVIYDVCIDIDGKTYSIFNTVPSGMANEEYSYFDANLVDNVLTLQVYENESPLHSAYHDRSLFLRLVSRRDDKRNKHRSLDG